MDDKNVMGLVLPGPAGDGGFVDGALRAARRLSEAGAVIDVRHEVPARPDPRWSGAYLHGIQFESFARDHAGELPLVLGDRPASLDGLGQVAVIDWCWDQGARVIGALAAAVARRLGGVPGLVAGPPVLTQRRVAGAFADGVARVAALPVEITHLSAFDDVPGGRIVGQRMAQSCAVLAHSSDGAGEAACAEARDRGRPTMGFLGELDDHLALLRSSTEQVVGHGLELLLAGSLEPGIIACGLDTPFQDVHLAGPERVAELGLDHAELLDVLRAVTGTGHAQA